MENTLGLSSAQKSIIGLKSVNMRYSGKHGNNHVLKITKINNKLEAYTV